MATFNRVDDFERLKRIDETVEKFDDKLNKIAIAVAETCTTVAVHDKDLNGNGVKGLKARMSAVERIVYIAVGGGGVIVFLVKLFHW